MKIESKTRAIILLIILIAIGGIVMYGEDRDQEAVPRTEGPTTPPKIKGPTTPPPTNEPRR